MKLRTNFLLSFALLAFSSYTIVSNNDDLIKKIATQLNTYLQQAPEEKVYLHFDKPYYMAGETMWFKAYLFDAQAHGIDSVSRILYVDLIQPEKGTILKHLTLKCTSGTTNGDFKLDEKLPEGVYTLRAYTHYMRNFSDDFFFKKEMKIWQNKPHESPNEDELKALGVVADCPFFPESGNLVSDVLSRVGFKAVNKMGRGLEVQGFILKNNTDTICFFKSEHLGMGMLSFTPKMGSTYTAKVKNADGSLTTFPLPKAVANGYVMLVDNISNKNNIKVYVNNSHPQAADKAGELVVIGQQRGTICFTAKIPNTKATVPLTIARQTVPDDGIVQITLFNTDGTPLCERVVFIKKQTQQFNLTIKADKTAYKPREKVTLMLEATDSLGKPVVGHFSLAATDSKQVTPPQYESNILSYLLLTSDLKGFIEEPAYYFKPNDFTATRHLDYLMMTQGWRRFTWQNVIAQRTPRIDYPLEQGLSLTGKALRYNKKASINTQMTLFLKPKEEKNAQLSIGQCDSVGRFAFYNLDFSDTCQFLVQGVKEKGGRGLDITLDSVSLPAVSKAVFPASLIAFNAQTFAEFLKRTAQALEFERQLKLKDEQLLNTVEVKAKRIQKTDGRRIYGNTGKSIALTDENCIRYRSIFDAIQMEVSGVQVNMGTDGEYIVSSRGGTLNFSVDGFATDNSFVSSINPCDVEAIDVLRGAEAAIFGMQGGTAGMVNVLLKTGSYLGASQPAPGIVTGRRIGYPVAKEFYAPQYNVSKPEHDLPDFRSTIFWQPSVKTDATGKAVFSFWNSDAKTTVQVNVEGFSNKGRVAVGRFEYTVQ